MSERPENKFILVRETVAGSIIRDTYTVAGLVFLIGLGWLIGSDAMQWFGGILAFISLIGRASHAQKKSTYTRKEAFRALLAEENAE